MDSPGDGKSFWTVRIRSFWAVHFTPNRPPFINRPSTFTPTQNPHDFFQPSESNLVQKRKSVTEDLISPKKSKLAELAETAVSIQNEKFLEKRKDLDSYTGCLPKVNFYKKTQYQFPMVLIRQSATKKRPCVSFQPTT